MLIFHENRLQNVTAIIVADNALPRSRPGLLARVTLMPERVERACMSGGGTRFDRFVELAALMVQNTMPAGHIW